MFRYLRDCPLLSQYIIVLYYNTVQLLFRSYAHWKSLRNTFFIFLSLSLVLPPLDRRSSVDGGKKQSKALLYRSGDLWYFSDGLSKRNIEERTRLQLKISRGADSVPCAHIGRERSEFS